MFAGEILFFAGFYLKIFTDRVIDQLIPAGRDAPAQEIYLLFRFVFDRDRFQFTVLADRIGIYRGYRDVRVRIVSDFYLELLDGYFRTVHHLDASDIFSFLVIFMPGFRFIAPVPVPEIPSDLDLIFPSAFGFNLEIRINVHIRLSRNRIFRFRIFLKNIPLPFASFTPSPLVAVKAV